MFQHMDQSFTEVDFSHQDLRDGYGADLEKADLRNADLSRAHFAKARLNGVDLRGAVMDGIDFKSFEIRGTRMDTAQAVALARSYGVIID